jgi:Flp pilus assembly protein CpaB
MAETVVWNKKLLLAALAVGVVAVILFYVYSSMAERSLRGENIRVFKWQRTILANEKVSPQDVISVEIPQNQANALEGVVQDTERDKALLNEGMISRTVHKNDFVFYKDLLNAGGTGPDQGITGSKKALAIPIDPSAAPVGMLSVNGRIDLHGRVSMSGKPPQEYVLIRNLKVLGLGAQTAEADNWASRTKSAYQAGSTNYRSVTVEVDEDVALQLGDLLPHVDGKVWVIVRNRADASPDSFNGKINPELMAVLKQPVKDKGEVIP